MLNQIFYYLAGQISKFPYLYRIKGISKIKSIKGYYKSKEFFFIQIGANDGLMSDPIRYYIKKYLWSGIFVEPISTYFKELQNNYKLVNANLIFENSAITDKTEKRVIHKINEQSAFIPNWMKGIASLNKDSVLSHKYAVKSIDELITTEEVNCISLNELFLKHKIKKIDLLVIDVEGNELSIIRQLPNIQFKPKVIFFESKHLEKDDFAEISKIISDLGYVYKLNWKKTDCLAFYL